MYLKTSIFLTVTMVLAVFANTSPKTIQMFCDTDRDCPETKYCYSSNLCVDCFNCSFVANRQNGLKRCSKSIIDCGDCLPGYARDTYNLVKMRCIEINVVAEPHKMNDSVTFNSNWVGLFIVCVVLIFGLMSYYCFNSKRRELHEVSVPESWSMNEMGMHRCNIDSSPPPSYHEDYIDDGNVSYSFQFRITEHCENDEQKAIPYFFEDLSVENLENIQFNGQQNNNAVVVQNTVSNVDIHDETTTPSFWTPGASYGHTTTNENNAVSGGDDVSPSNKRKRTDADNDANDDGKKPKRKVSE